MDSLSEILRTVHVLGASFAGKRFSAPWCYLSSEASLPVAGSGSCIQQIVALHLVVDGECVVETDTSPPVHARAGDVLVFPTGRAHRMVSPPESKLGSCRGGDAGAPVTGPTQVPACGGTTQIISGHLACDTRLAQTFFSDLPEMIRVNLRTTPSGDWLEASLHHALAEARTPHPGSLNLLAKLAELLFIEVLRQYARQGNGNARWLVGLGDRVVGNALRLLHQRPGHEWTLEELSRASGSSRSILAERFQSAVGTTPMLYLTQWRMSMAANLLRRSNAPLSRIAEEVGYRCDTSFSRAFRREYGQPPAAWRRKCSQHRESSAERAASRC